MVPSSPATILEYLDSGGRNPFAAWFDGLHAEAAVKVAVAVNEKETEVNERWP